MTTRNDKHGHASCQGDRIYLTVGGVTASLNPTEAKIVLRDLAAAIEQHHRAHPATTPLRFNARFGANVRKYRERRGLTQAQLAGFAGLSKSFVCDLENGKRCVSAYNLLTLAQALEVGVAKLMEGVTL